MQASELVLDGLDGTNPLGFLAALGTLAVVRDTEARLGWQRSAATWHPVLYDHPAAAPQALCEVLSQALKGRVVDERADEARRDRQKEFEVARKAVADQIKEIKSRGLRGKERREAFDKEVAPLERSREAKRGAWLAALKEAAPRPELALGQKIDCEAQEFRGYAEGFLADSGPGNRETLDLLAAFGSDACLMDKSERIRATPFCFITGSGHQYFLDTVLQLLRVVTPERVHAALFEPWAYRDEKLSMRWDPIEDRRYALMDRDPTASDNKSRTVWMANLLAYRGLCLLPSAPGRKGLSTTGWSQGSCFTWPIWDGRLGPDCVRSLLQLKELLEPDLHRANLQARGIAATFRSRRIQVGNPPLHKLNFSPAVGL
ncbi:hypothetical protein DYH09_19645 [bacterium CPR1]|nr:hypothetical protein [bacterium CPR1]